MTTLPHPHQPLTPTIQNRHQLDTVIENIVQLQLEHDELRRTQDREITEIRQKYRAPLAQVERYLVLETSWVETWARENPEAFGEQQSLSCTHATIGFRVSPPRVERASRKWTWSAISLKLADIAWGKRYLRVPPLEVNKEALLADRAELSAVELRQVGIKIVQDERFFIAPHCETENVAGPIQTGRRRRDYLKLDILSIFMLLDYMLITILIVRDSIVIIFAWLSFNMDFKTLKTLTVKKTLILTGVFAYIILGGFQYRDAVRKDEEEKNHTKKEEDFFYNKLPDLMRTSASIGPQATQAVLDIMPKISPSSEAEVNKPFDLSSSLSDLQKILFQKQADEKEKQNKIREKDTSIKNKIYPICDYAITTLNSDLSKMLVKNKDKLSVKYNGMDSIVPSKEIPIASIEMQPHVKWSFNVFFSYGSLTTNAMRISCDTNVSDEAMDLTLSFDTDNNKIKCNLIVSGESIPKECSLNEYQPTIDELLRLMVAAQTKQLSLIKKD